MILDSGLYFPLKKPFCSGTGESGEGFVFLGGSRHLPWAGSSPWSGCQQQCSGARVAGGWWTSAPRAAPRWCRACSSCPRTWPSSQPWLFSQSPPGPFLEGTNKRDVSQQGSQFPPWIWFGGKSPEFSRVWRERGFLKHQCGFPCSVLNSGMWLGCFLSIMLWFPLILSPSKTKGLLYCDFDQHLVTLGVHHRGELGFSS